MFTKIKNKFYRTRPKPVFLTGFARGGTTWLKTMIGALPTVTEYPGQFEIPRHAKQFDNDGWDSFLADRLKGKPYAEEWVVAKSPRYTANTDIFLGPLVEHPLILIFRDPKDVMASLKGTGAEWTDKRATTELGVTFIHDYAKGLLELATNHPKSIAVSYERLMIDPLSELERITAFLGIVCEDDELERIYAANSFKSISGRDNSVEKKGHKRKGVVGDYKQKLSQDEINFFQRLDWVKEIKQYIGADPLIESRTLLELSRCENIKKISCHLPSSAFDEEQYFQYKTFVESQTNLGESKIEIKRDAENYEAINSLHWCNQSLKIPFSYEFDGTLNIFVEDSSFSIVSDYFLAPR